MNQLVENSNEKYQTLIIAVVVGVALMYVNNWLSSYFYFDQVAIEINTKEEEFVSLQRERQHLEQVKANLEILEKSSYNLEDDYKKLEPLIPEEKDLADILAYLYKSGTNRNLRLSHFSQSQKISRQGALNQLPITVSVLGSEDDVLRYMNDFVRFNRILNIDSIKFKEETNPQYIGNVNAEVKFSAYLSDPNAGQAKTKK